MGQDFKLSDLGDVRVHLVYLGEGIKGFVYVSKKNVPHIFINNSLSPECAIRTLAHEIYHLRYDKLSHGIGLDRQQEELEQRANDFATKNAHLLSGLMCPTAI